MNESLPKVSIVIPTYNGSKYIQQAIDSCLIQTYKNIELIIVDDVSTDDTPEIIKRYQDARIKYIRHNSNLGLPYALNTGFANSSGEYLTWTSDDNYYTEDAIEKMLLFLQANNAYFVYCDFYRINEVARAEPKLIRLANGSALAKRNDVGGCFLYAKKVREDVGDYDPQAILAEDYDYWIRVAEKFTLHHLAEPLYFYRWHNHSLTLSKHYDIRVADILVKLKNRLIDINVALNLTVSLIAARYPGNLKINTVIARAVFVKKIRRTLKDFIEGRIDEPTARLILRRIIAGWQDGVKKIILTLTGIFEKIYRWLIYVFKVFDKATHYSLSRPIRAITDMNTRRYWDKKLASYHDSWRDFPYKNLLEFLPQGRPFSLLDIGCALGDGCIVLKNNFPLAEINGADFSQAAIKKAKAKTDKVNFLVLDILKDLPPKKYDYITLLSTLEHFNDPYLVVDKCLRYVQCALVVQSPYTKEIDEPRLYSRGLHRYLFNEHTFAGYNFKILKITDFIPATGYRYIIYELKPGDDK